MTTYGEASVVEEDQAPHLDLSFVSPETMDQIRREQYRELNNASFDAILSLDHWRDAITPGLGLNSKAQQEVAAEFDEDAVAYVERHLESVPPDARDLVRKTAVAWVQRCSVHRMDDEEWYLGKRNEAGQRQPAGWDYLAARIRKLIATYEGTPIDDDPQDDTAHPFRRHFEDDPLDEGAEREPRHRRLRDLPMLGAVAISNGFGRLRDRLYHRHEEEEEVEEHEERRRAWPYAVVAAGGLALAGAGLYLLLDRAGATHILTHPHPGRTPSPPSTFHPSPPSNGHHLVSQVPRGTELYGPAQTSELTRNWAAGTNAHHILHFVGERRGHLTLQLEDVAPDGTVINGHAVDLAQADNLRANITVNVRGQLNTISVPMQGDSLDLHGNLAKLLQSGKFSTVEVVRQHGAREQVFSTVVGNGHSISARAFRSSLNQIQQTTTGQGAGGNSNPHNIANPPAPHKTPPPTYRIRPGEPNEAPGDDTGFWHNPIVDGTMIAAGLAIAGGAAVAADRNRHRTTEEIEESQGPRPLGLDILRGDDVRLPPEREQEYAEEIQDTLQGSDTAWLQPGRTREEYIHDFTPVAEHAVDVVGGDMRAGDRDQLVAHLVREYCAGTPEQIYERLRGLNDAEVAPDVR